MPDRKALLDQIDQISFLVNDATLYLDTHPTDERALNFFQDHSKKRKELLDAYQKEFEPLTIDCVRTDEHGSATDYCAHPGQKHFTWTDGPAPWEGGLA